MLFVNKYILTFVFSCVLCSSAIAMQEMCEKIIAGASAAEIEEILSEMKIPSIYASAALPALASETSIGHEVIDVLIKYADAPDLKKLFPKNGQEDSSLRKRTYVDEQVEKKISEQEDADKISQDFSDSSQLPESFDDNPGEWPGKLDKKTTQKPSFSYITWTSISAGIICFMYYLYSHKKRPTSR